MLKRVQHDEGAVAAIHFFFPTRCISHSSSMPLCSLTRRRTSSPSASMSAAVALPRFSRKLQCFSDTWASPTVRPRQPAASISFQALVPGGFLKVEPPVRSEEHTSELQSLMRISYAVFCLKKKKNNKQDVIL